MGKKVKFRKTGLGCACDSLMGDPFEGFSAKGISVNDITLKGEGLDYKILDSINFGSSSIYSSNLGALTWNEMTTEQREAAGAAFKLTPEYAAIQKQIAAALAAEQAATDLYAASTPTAQLSMDELQMAARTVLNKYGSLGNVPNFRDIETVDPILWKELRRQEAVVSEDTNIGMAIVWLEPTLEPTALWVGPSPNPIRTAADKIKAIPQEKRLDLFLVGLKSLSEVFIFNTLKSYSPVLANDILARFNKFSAMSLKDRAKEVVSMIDASYIGLRPLEYLRLLYPEFFKEIVLRQAAVKYSLSPEGIAARKAIEIAQASMTQAEKDADDKIRAVAEAKAQAEAAAVEQARLLAEARAATDAIAKAEAEKQAALQAQVAAATAAQAAALAQAQAIESQNAQAKLLADQQAAKAAQLKADADKIAAGAIQASTQATANASNATQAYSAAVAETKTATQIAAAIAATPAKTLALSKSKINQSKIHPMLFFGLIKRRA